MRFSQMPIKDRIITCCIIFILWLMATVMGCLIGSFIYDCFIEFK